MRIMAVDYGDVRTGLAVSDISGSLAGEAWMIEEKTLKRAGEKIAEEASRRGVELIVVGYPRNMDGTRGYRAEKSERLAEQIRDLSAIEVTFWDERMTTVSAQRILTEAGRRGVKRKKAVDAVAASLILEGYINGQKK